MQCQEMYFEVFLQQRKLPKRVDFSEPMTFEHSSYLRRWQVLFVRKKNMYLAAECEYEEHSAPVSRPRCVCRKD